MPRRKPPAGRRAARTAERLHRAAIRLLRLLRREDDAAGLSAPRLSALSVLVFRGPQTLAALAAAEQVSRPTMTMLVQAMEREGLVSRRSNPGDARSVLVAPRARGRRLMLAGRDRRVERLAEWIARRAPAERQALARALAVIEKLGSEAATSPHGAPTPRASASGRRPGTVRRPR